MRQILAIIRSASLNNQKLIFLPRQSLYVNILEILHKNGFIQSFEERGTFLIIRLKQIYWKTWGQPSKALTYINTVSSNKRKRITLNKYDSERLQELEGDAVCIILSTDKGIITACKASKKCVGGIPLIKVY